MTTISFSILSMPKKDPKIPDFPWTHVVLFQNEWLMTAAILDVSPEQYKRYSCSIQKYAQPWSLYPVWTALDFCLTLI